MNRGHRDVLLEGFVSGDVHFTPIVHLGGVEPPTLGLEGPGHSIQVYVSGLFPDDLVLLPGLVTGLSWSVGLADPATVLLALLGVATVLPVLAALLLLVGQLLLMG